MNWQCLGDAEAGRDWNRVLQTFDDASIYQTIEWGENRRALGWTPYRWLATDDGKPVAMAQGLLRRAPGGAGIVWIPGGPVGPVHSWNDAFRKVVKQSTGLAFIYCRFHSMRAAQAAETDALHAQGWRMPRQRLGAAASLLYDVSAPAEQRVAASSKNWRHNLKRAGKAGHIVARWDAPDIDEMRSVYAEMEDYKQLSPQHSVQNLRALYDHVRKRMITFSCRDAGGRLVSFRACATLGDKAWDMLAATAVAGRKTYASYATFWALTGECSRRGIRHYDLSGVDPQHNRGVYDFKQGTGALPLEYLGEWEWAQPRLLALPANWLIGRRRDGI